MTIILADEQGSSVRERQQSNGLSSVGSEGRIDGALRLLRTKRAGRLIGCGTFPFSFYMQVEMSYSPRSRRDLAAVCADCWSNAVTGDPMQSGSQQRRTGTGSTRNNGVSSVFHRLSPMFLVSTLVLGISLLCLIRF